MENYDLTFEEAYSDMVDLDTLLETSAANIPDSQSQEKESHSGAGDSKESVDPKLDEKLNKAEESAMAACALMDFLAPTEISELAESASEMEETGEILGVAMEKTIIRMDKKARLKHLSKQAVFTEARKANDPKFKKLLTLWKMERAIEAELQKKYKSRADKRAKEQIKAYSSNGIKKIQKSPINSQTDVGKGKISTHVAARAVAQSKKMFSGSNKAHVGSATGRK